MVVALLLLGACSSGTQEREPGVEALTTDLSYGIEDEEQAAPPNTGARSSRRTPPPPPNEDAAPPTINPFAIPRPGGGGGGGGGGGLTCPTAPPEESPNKEATFEVEGMPAGGFYLWAVDGGELRDAGGRLVRIGFSDFIRREVQSVKGEEGEFQFQIEEEELTVDPGPDRVTTTFEVDSGGVSLTRIERRSSEGDVTVFSPTPTVTYLPTPVSVGPEHSFSSRGVDLTSSTQPQILEHEGFVRGRETIDACGEEIRAWIVEAKQTYRIGAEEVDRDYTYGIATQAGALFVFEDVQTCDGRDADGNCQPAETTDDGEGRFRIDYTADIGQLEPDEE